MGDRRAHPCAKTVLAGWAVAFAAAIGVCWALGGRLVPWLAALLIFCCSAAGAAAGAKVSRRPSPRDNDRGWEEFERQFREYARTHQSRQRP